MSEIMEMKITKGIDSYSRDNIAHINYKDNFWGWLQSRRMTKEEWILIGKEMNWLRQGGN